MGNKSYLTPRYIINRANLFLYTQLNPGLPWLTKEAIHLLNQLIKPTDVLLEFGSGRSTIWFAQKCAKVISVEHHAGWHEKVSQQLKEKKLTNVDYRLRAEDDESDPENAEYCRIFNELRPGSIDIALVDGKHRAYTAIKSLPLLKSGGILLIDNVNWFLPSNTHSPASVKTEKDMTEEWTEVYDAIKDYRSIWTSNGITDTAFYFKA